VLLRWGSCSLIGYGAIHSDRTPPVVAPLDLALEYAAVRAYSHRLEPARLACAT
jgi:hypothetical protein